MQAGASFDQALVKVRATTVFTTHTPVPAGHDMFPVWMMEKYFANFWPKLGLDRDQFMALASQHESWGEVFSMSLLAIKASERINGVSELHGEVSRKMFAHLWPDRPVAQVPIGHITNGVHTDTWLARRMGASSTAIWAAIGARASTIARYGTMSGHSRRGVVGSAPTPQAPAGRLCA